MSPDLYSAGVIADFTGIISNGTRIRFRYFTGSITAGSFDDTITLYQSGTDFYTSGLVLSLSNLKGSKDAMLIEAGQLLTNDVKCFILGNVQTSGIFRIGIGSPTGLEYSTVPEGILESDINNVSVFKKLYLRVLTNGSLMGE